MSLSSVSCALKDHSNRCAHRSVPKPGWACFGSPGSSHERLKSSAGHQTRSLIVHDQKLNLCHILCRVAFEKRSRTLQVDLS